MSKPDEMRLPQGSPNDRWQSLFGATTARFERQYRNEAGSLPEEVQALPIYGEWKSGLLNTKLASPFWELAKPAKNQRCLDLGCGVSFLLYPWRDWQAYFYGQDLSPTAVELLKARGSQLNSKLFKSIALA
ncbi:MAG: SAM-dependent methyltransferase, partial [Cyanobacteriota bacterium]|nr:SAM-dependent methyltransferase [Cyanobacteriota bacterium]